MILNLSSNDYANYSHDNARALRSIGLDCLDFTEQKHFYHYKSQSRRLTKAGMAYYIEKADIIQIMHSNVALFNLAVKLNPKAKIYIYHTGTIYRKNHAHLNHIFKGYKTITDQTEFMTLDKHKYIVSPVNYDRARIYNTGKKVIGHYPSVPETKGTPKILEMLSKVKPPFILKHSNTIVPHAKQIERISQSDIYIELFKPEINGDKYGCFGVTALEAAALGKMVVTQNLYPDVYNKEYGHCPLTIANTEHDFLNVIDGFLSMNRLVFRNLQKETSQIMKETHSYEATGYKIAEFIYG